MSNVLLCVQELPAVRPKLECEAAIEDAIAKIRLAVLLPGEPNGSWQIFTKVTGYQQDYWQPLQEWHCLVDKVGLEVMVFLNLRLIAFKAACHKVVGLWFIDSGNRVALVHDCKCKLEVYNYSHSRRAGTQVWTWGNNSDPMVAWNSKRKITLDSKLKV